MFIDLVKMEVVGGGLYYLYLERLIDGCSLKRSIDVYLICLILNFLAHHRRGADRPEQATFL